MYWVHMIKNETGERRRIDIGVSWVDGDASTYWWQDGNFSCDCNRAQLWGGCTDPQRCGDERFTITHIELPDGTEIKIDGVETK